jgi:hypothetical protein
MFLSAPLSSSKLTICSLWRCCCARHSPTAASPRFDCLALPAVLGALQFWLGLVLPTVLLTRAQCRQYVAWRLRQRQVRQMKRQVRRQEAESWGFGFREPSSSSSSSSSCPSNSDAGSSDGERGGDGASSAHCGSASGKGDCAPRDQQQQSQQPQAAQRSRQRWPQWPVAAHPDDWQYDTAGRLLHAVRLTPQRLALLLPLALVLYRWHRAFFPA